jgi:hypothetical protein
MLDRGHDFGHRHARRINLLGALGHTLGQVARVLHWTYPTIPFRRRGTNLMYFSYCQLENTVVQ